MDKFRPERVASKGSMYRWKSKYGGMDLSEARRLEEENRQLKRLVSPKYTKLIKMFISAKVGPLIKRMTLQMRRVLNLGTAECIS